MQKLFLFFTYIGINGLVYLIIRLFSLSIVNNIMVIAIFSFIYIVLIYHFGGSPADQRNFYRWINPKVAFIWIISIVVSMYIYQILPGLPIIENNILYAGVRLTWYVPFYTTAIMILVVSNILFIRFLFVGKKRPKNMKFKEASLNGVIVLISYVVLLSKNFPTNFIVPIIRIEISVVPLLAVGYGILFMGFSALTQFLSQYSKTLIAGALLSGIIFALFLAASQVTFIY